MAEVRSGAGSGLAQTTGFEQDFGARLRVVRLRVRSGLAMVAGLLALSFGALAWLDPDPTYRWVGLGIIGVAMVLASLGGLSSLRRARQAAPGRLVLTGAGMQFSANDRESKSGSVRWDAVGGVIAVSDWQYRRLGVVTVAVLPPGQTRWRTSASRGSFGNAVLVVAWLRAADALRVGALVKSHMEPLG